MFPCTLDLGPEDWRCLSNPLRYLGCEVLHRSLLVVPTDRRELPWKEMDRCLSLAGRIERLMPGQEI